MRAAYDALDARTKAEVEGLVCLHSLLFSRETIGFTGMTAEEKAAFDPVRQPLARSHPVTGRRSLFLSAHAGADRGMDRSGGAHVPARSDRVRDAARVRLFA